MDIIRKTVLVVGSTGTIGRLVVDEAIREGHAVRALVRNPGKADQLPREAQVVVGDVTAGRAARMEHHRRRLRCQHDRRERMNPSILADAPKLTGTYHVYGITRRGYGAG